MNDNLEQCIRDRAYFLWIDAGRPIRTRPTTWLPWGVAAALGVVSVWARYSPCAEAHVLNERLPNSPARVPFAPGFCGHN